VGAAGLRLMHRRRSAAARCAPRLIGRPVVETEGHLVQIRRQVFTDSFLTGLRLQALNGREGASIWDWLIRRQAGG
jgi:hypothetical protein